MQTDREMFVVTLGALGYKSGRLPDNPHVQEGLVYEELDRESVGDARRLPIRLSTAIRLGRGRGYAGFYVEFYFDTAGAYLGHGVWE